MPAIQPERLKIQAKDLSKRFNNPPAFIRELIHLFEYYTERSGHQDNSSKSNTAALSYNIAAPIYKHILVELNPLIVSQPKDAQALVKSLWSQKVLDAQLLALSILGRIPVTSQKSSINFLTKLAADIRDDELYNALRKQGLNNLIIHSPDALVLLAKKSLAGKINDNRILGLICLQALVSHSKFDNLPVVFKILSAYLKIAENQFRPYLLDLLQSLIEKSPIETSLFIDKCVSDAKNRIPKWLLRYSLESFPSDLQPRLRKALRRK